MAKIPDKIIQIAMVHAPLITSVVKATQNKQYLHLLEPELQKAEKNGWIDLVDRIRKILNGKRNKKLLAGLDEEDAAIVFSILVGIQSPDALKKIQPVVQGKFAPAALAEMIKAARKDISSKSSIVDPVISTMKNSQQKDMQILAEIIDQLCQMESGHKKNTDQLKLQLSENGRQLFEQIEVLL